MKIKRALISVYNKDGIDSFAKVLVDFGVEIISSGGTAQFLRENGIPVIKVSDITGFPEILNGRVKTINPRISAGILALRDNAEHLSELKKHKIQLIDMVVVNLYPFLDALSDRSKNFTDMLELIDIGGPTLIRAAAKNHPFVTVITSPEHLKPVANELRQLNGEISPQLRQKLALEAFQHTAYYDAKIADYFLNSEDQEKNLPHRFVLPLQNISPLRYGENPHQKAGFYQSDPKAEIDGIEQLHGLKLSYNNLLDVDGSLNTIASFEEPTVAIIKHTNPCGIGSDENLVEAYDKAFATDPISAFGGIMSLNRCVSPQLAQKLKSHFLEVLLAPEFDSEALEILKKKKKLRILKYLPKFPNKLRYSYRSVLNGFLVQDTDSAIWDKNLIRVVSKREPTSDEWLALAFNWRVVKHIKSNAVVFGTKDRTLGVGAGQMSRIDSVELAVQKSKKSGLSLTRSVLASDAFFPFRDGVDAAVEAGASAIVQPGGSIRDEQVIAAADDHKIAMVFTGIRHFRH